MAIDYKSLYRFGGYTVDQKRHLARLLAVAEAATTSAEVSRKVVHKTLANKFARDETERWQRYFEGIRAAIDAQDTAYDLDPHMHGWRNYQLERLVKSFGTTIIGDKSYAVLVPSQDLTTATGADWTDTVGPATLALAGSTITGGVDDTRVTDNGVGGGSADYQRAQKILQAGVDYSVADGRTSIVFRCFIKKGAAGSGVLVYIDSSHDYSESYWEYNNLTGLDTGGSYTSGADADYAISTCTTDSNYWEILLSLAPSGGFVNSSNIINFRIYPRGVVASETGSLDVGNTEAYWDTTIAAIQGTAPVFTT